MTTTKAKIYTFSGRVNEIPFSKRTSDIDKTLLEIKPEFVFCDSYFTISRGAGKNKVSTERKLNLLQSKRMFGDSDVRAVFINNLVTEF